MMAFPKKIIRNRPLQHLLFWSASFYILLNHFRTSSKIESIDYIYTGIFFISLVFATYVHLLWIVPKFFHSGKYYFYLPLLALDIILSIELNIFSFEHLVDYIFPGYYLISYFDRWEIFKYIFVFISLSSLFHFSKSWFQLQESRSRIDKLQKEKIETELKALKNQINPHFLFNSLNSIYSLVLKKSDVAPEALLKLSDNMRYMIYDANTFLVPLSKEISFIDNYVDLQKLRVSNRESISFKKNIDTENKMIAPLMLIPLIENGFKHGIKGDTERTFINILISGEEEILTLKVINNKGVIDDPEKREPGGFGIENLKRRLKLIYPEKHHLIIEENNDTFSISLEIKLS